MDIEDLVVARQSGALQCKRGCFTEICTIGRHGARKAVGASSSAALVLEGETKSSQKKRGSKRHHRDKKDPRKKAVGKKAARARSSTALASCLWRKGLLSYAKTTSMATKSVDCWSST